MSSIMANLSPPQRRLLNFLHDTGKSAPGTTLRFAIEAVSCDRAELVGLALADLVEAHRQPRGELVDIPGTPQDVLERPHIRLRQTNLGISWVRENPLNALLRAVDTAPRGQFDLDEAVKACDDKRVIVGAVSDGYATLHYRGDLRETKFDGADGRYEFRHPADFVLLPTSKIRTVLGPKAG